MDVLGADDERFERVDRRTAAMSLLRRLPPRDRALLTMRFEAHMTQSEIGARLGCSQMQVPRLLRQLLARLASPDDAASAQRHSLT